jgi:Flp pilus assembly protein TadD
MNYRLLAFIPLLFLAACLFVYEDKVEADAVKKKPADPINSQESASLDWADGRRSSASTKKAVKNHDGSVSATAAGISERPHPRSTESVSSLDPIKTAAAKPIDAATEPDLVQLEQALKLIKTESSAVDLKTIGDLIIGLRRKVTDQPQDPELRLSLGTYLYIAGDYEGAAGELRHVLSIKPTSLAAHTLLGRVLAEAGEHEASVFEFKRALEIEPGSQTVHCLYAQALALHGDISESLNEFRRSIGIAPTAPALSGLAEALLNSGDTEGAVKAARKAVSLEPNSALAHVILTKALLLSGDFESAARTAREALLLNPSFAESHIALGRTLFTAKKIDAAIDEFKQAVALDPLSAEARNDLGYALYARGDVLNAVNEFRLSLRLNPHFTEARNNLEIAIYGVSGIKTKHGRH